MEWISVNERLPEKQGTYIVYAPTYSGGSSSGLNSINGVMFARWKKHWSIEVGYYKRPGCVTYWMYLPQPPKEENFSIDVLPQIGKTVFLTREEAEKALEEQHYGMD